MKSMFAIFYLLLSTHLYAADSLNLTVNFEQRSVNKSGWTVNKDVVLPYSVATVVASEKDGSTGANRVLEITPTQKPNDLIELKIKFLLLSNGTQELLQEAAIVTKLGERATLSSEADEYNDEVIINVHPRKP